MPHQVQCQKCMPTAVFSPSSVVIRNRPHFSSLQRRCCTLSSPRPVRCRHAVVGPTSPSVLPTFHLLMLHRIASAMFHVGSRKTGCFSTITRRKELCLELVHSGTKFHNSAGIDVAEVKVLQSRGTLDEDLSLERHVTVIVRGCSYHVRESSQEGRKEGRKNCSAWTYNSSLLQVQDFETVKYWSVHDATWKHKL